MIVLASGLKPIDGFAAAVALRELLDAPHPIAIVDGLGLEHGGADLDRDALLDLMEAIVDRHEAAGPHAYVVTVPAVWKADPERLSFFLRRRRDQQVAIARFDQTASGSDVQGFQSLFDEPTSMIKPWSPKPPRLETERLVLTWPTPAQIDGYYEAIAGSTIFDTLCWDGPESPADLHDHQLRIRREHARGKGHMALFAIIERASDTQIGAISFRPHTPDDARADIGFALAPQSHAKGYGTEAVRAIVDYAFRERGVERIEAEVFVGNDASRRVLEKAGFEVEGVKRANHRKRDRFVDEWLMARTRGEQERLGA